MNYGIVVKVLGKLLILETLLMIPSLFVALYYNEGDILAFIISALITLGIGFLMSRKKVINSKIKIKEALAIVTLGWVVAAFFGMLPFIISGSIPSIVDAYFETVSGLTTTGATILNEIESLPKGILFWRSFTHWIGGMGILVFTVALLPTIGVGGFQIFKAESPGPIADKIVPRIKDTAKILYMTYIGITFLEVILLMIGGMSFYEACVHTFGTVGTGGFSVKNASIGAYNSSYIHVVISIFMILSGTNFALYFALYKKRWKEVIKDQEFRLYIGIISISTILIAINLMATSYKNIGLSLRDSLFQVSSIITTTGYATVDFDQWTTFSKAILFMLMFVGGCSGSTGGGVKNIRILVLLKLIKREIAKIFHPRAMIPVKIGNKSISTDKVSSIMSFFVLYIFIFIIGTIIISLEGLDLVSSASSVAATLGNIGPGFEFVGPTRNFSEFNNFSKVFFSALMLLGRLELFTIIALVAPKSWKNAI